MATRKVHKEATTADGTETTVTDVTGSVDPADFAESTDQDLVDRAVPFDGDAHQIVAVIDAAKTVHFTTKENADRLVEHQGWRKAPKSEQPKA